MEGNLTVCIVEDNELVMNSIKSLCKLRQFKPVPFDSAEEFLSHPIREFDCFIFDYRLPGVSGFELLKKIRRRGDETPAILVSGNFNVPAMDEIKGISNTVCLSKPFRPAEFLELLERVAVNEPIV